MKKQLQLHFAARRRPPSGPTKNKEEQRHKEEGSRQKVDGSNQDVCPPFSPKLQIIFAKSSLPAIFTPTLYAK
jgi:hypothetical protein